MARLMRESTKEVIVEVGDRGDDYVDGTDSAGLFHRLRGDDPESTMSP